MLPSFTDVVPIDGRVGGGEMPPVVRQVAVGASFTVALTTDGKVYQMGETGASGRAKWEGAKAPELVRLFSLHQTICVLIFRRPGGAERSATE